MTGAGQGFDEGSVIQSTFHVDGGNPLPYTITWICIGRKLGFRNWSIESNRHSEVGYNFLLAKLNSCS